MNPKTSGEINKAVWLLIRIKDNKLITKYRSKTLAMLELNKLNRMKKEFKLERDNSYRNKLRENLNKNE